MRAFGDGFVSLLLPIYLLDLGFGTLAIGSIITSTLLGSALLTFWIGVVAHRFPRRSMLRGACLLMIATGAAFALSTDYWPLVIVAFIGTINPSAGDVSLFLPLEQTVLAQSVSPADRTALFARYSLVGTLLGGMGVLAATVPEMLSHAFDVDHLNATQWMFALYGVLGVGALGLYSRLSPAVEAPTVTPAALGPSKGIVYRLAMLFALDSFGSGFFVQSMLALWLYQRFGLSVSTGSGDIFCEQRSRGVVPDRRTGRQAIRTDQHDGVHPPAGEHAPDAAAVRAESAGRDRVVARARACCNRWMCRRARRTSWPW